MSGEALELLVSSCRGLSEQRIRQLAARALARHGCLDAADLDDVLEEKRLALGRSDLLEYCPTAADPSEIGGLNQLKTWLDRRRLALRPLLLKVSMFFPRSFL